MGSSPLSRGIPQSTEVLPLSHGIIPALAGNTCGCTAYHSTLWDHPRSRGEYRRYEPHDGILAGSSPLSRGIPGLRPGQLWGGGIIPALAGNTSSSSCRRATDGDHPRSRGEYKLEHCPTCHETGSSPLSRGILRPGWTEHPGTRIIPALAGNTPVEDRTGVGTRDHPRSRGEYSYP